MAVSAGTGSAKCRGKLGTPQAERRWHPTVAPVKTALSQQARGSSDHPGSLSRGADSSSRDMLMPTEWSAGTGGRLIGRMAAARARWLNMIHGAKKRHVLNSGTRLGGGQVSAAGKRARAACRNTRMERGKGIYEYWQGEDRTLPSNADEDAALAVRKLLTLSFNN